MNAGVGDDPQLPRGDHPPQPNVGRVESLIERRRQRHAGFREGPHERRGVVRSCASGFSHSVGTPAAASASAGAAVDMVRRGDVRRPRARTARSIVFTSANPRAWGNRDRKRSNAAASGSHAATTRAFAAASIPGPPWSRATQPHPITAQSSTFRPSTFADTDTSAITTPPARRAARGVGRGVRRPGRAASHRDGSAPGRVDRRPFVRCDPVGEVRRGPDTPPRTAAAASPASARRPLDQQRIERQRRARPPAA